MQPPMTISTIIAGCQRNKRHCQRALVDRFSPMLFTVARRYAPDQSVAKDILQDSLITIFQRIDQFQATGSFEGWMRRIVINTALKRLDRKWVRREVHDQTILPEESTDPSIYDQLATEEIMCCIQQLPDGFRQIFSLYAIEGFKHREIAQMMGINESTSRSQYRRAKLQLQQLLLDKKIGLRYVK